MDKTLSDGALKENKKKVENLHKTAVDLEKIHEKEEIYQFAIDSARRILDFNISTILTEQDEKLIVKASHHKDVEKGTVLEKDKGIFGMTFNDGEPYLIDDIDEYSEAFPKSPDFKSVISVPIGDYGVFQVISNEKEYFSEHDLEMAKILVRHIEEAVKRVEYENELQKSEERYRLITENSNDMISLLELDTKIIFVNEAHERILGFSKEELIDGKAIDLIHPDFQDEVNKQIKEIIEDGSEKNIESKIQKKDGGYTWIASNLKVLNDEEGEPNRLVIVSRDISKRKEAEKKLREAERLYKNIFENTGNPTMIVEDDRTISLVNKELTELTGYSKEEIENNMPISDFVVEEDKEKLLKYHEKRRDEEESVPKKYTFKIISKFGHPIDVLCNVGLIPDSGKRITSFIDISKFKKTMKELRESQEAFRVMFENMTYGMVLLDPDLKILEINPKLKDSLKYYETDLINSDFSDIVSNKSENIIKNYKEDLIKNESDTAKGEIQIIDQNGEKIDYKINMSIVFDIEDEPLYFICNLCEK